MVGVMANQVKALDAAMEFLTLEAAGVPGAAASFARNFEERATAAEFDAYLHFLDLEAMNSEAA